ncbi:MAG: ABC transporter permease subunit [Myxococcaceae bacterium]
MAFRRKRVMAVFWKDSLDLLKNRGMLLSLFALPLVLVLVPVLIIKGYLANPDDGNLRALAQAYESNLPRGVDPIRFLIDKTLAEWFGLFLIMPVFVPVLISAHSIAGEKERRTIEPLLASPISSAELVAGKSLAALVPSVGITFVAFVIFCVLIDWTVWPYAHELVLPNTLWMFGVFVIAPLFAFFGNGVAVLVSARAADVRLAQQISGLVTLPILGLVGGQVAGVLRASTTYYALQGAAVLILDLILISVSVRLLDRERLISRWG